MDNESKTENTEITIKVLKEHFHGTELAREIIMHVLEILLNNYKLAIIYLLFLSSYIAAWLINLTKPGFDTTSYSVLHFFATSFPMSMFWYFFVAWIFAIFKLTKFIRTDRSEPESKHLLISLWIMGACHIITIIAAFNGYFLSA
jgi:hypothetical protein